MESDQDSDAERAAAAAAIVAAVLGDVRDDPAGALCLFGRLLTKSHALLRGGFSPMCFE